MSLLFKWGLLHEFWGFQDLMPVVKGTYLLMRNFSQILVHPWTRPSEKSVSAILIDGGPRFQVQYLQSTAAH